MRYVFVFLAILIAGPAWAYDDLILPSVDFSATAVHEVGAIRTRETIRYADGKLRIDRGNGFSATILDLRTQTQCLLMVNHTYLVLPMDSELFRQFIARTESMNGARKLGIERIDGLDTTKYAFENDGALAAAGSYWLTATGIMVKRQYQDGVFGRKVRHTEMLTNITFGKQPSALFSIPAGYKLAK